MKSINEVEAILLDTGLKASGLDFNALRAVQGQLTPDINPRRRGKPPTEEFPLANRMAAAGFILGMERRLDDADAIGSAELRETAANSSEVARALFESFPELNDASWMYFELGEWGATGDRTYLSRIMDRARHRDGTSAAISTSTQALGILQLAAFSNPAYLGIYAEMGFDPEAVKYGNNPSGRESFDALRGDREIEPDAPAVLDPDAVKVVAASQLPERMDVGPVAMVDLGGLGVLASVGINERDHFVITAFGPLSITDALAAISALTVSTRQLLLPLPYEGYQWDDYAGVELAPVSILFTPDTFEGERLGLYQPSPMAAVFIAAKVQYVEPDDDGNTWQPCFYRVGNGWARFEPLGAPVHDLNVAKAIVASQLRERLRDSGGTLPGSAPPPTPEEAAGVAVAPVSIEGKQAPVLSAAADAAPLHPVAQPAKKPRPDGRPKGGKKAKAAKNRGRKG